MMGRRSGENPDLSGNPALSGHWGAAAPLPLKVKRLLCSHVRELDGFYGQAKGTELRVNTISGISRARSK